MGPNQYTLTRVHGTNRFQTSDDRDIPELTRLEDVKPLYNKKDRGDNQSF